METMVLSKHSFRIRVILTKNTSNIWAGVMKTRDIVVFFSKKFLWSYQLELFSLFHPNSSITTCYERKIMKLTFFTVTIFQRTWLRNACWFAASAAACIFTRWTSDVHLRWPHLPPTNPSAGSFPQCNFDTSDGSLQQGNKWRPNISGVLIRIYYFNYFKFLDFKKNLKIGLSSVGKTYVVCALIRNALTCLYSNETSKYFGLEPPTLQDTLHDFVYWAIFYILINVHIYIHVFHIFPINI